MQGNTSINSYWGACVSLLSIITLIVYTAARFDSLQAKRDTVRSAILVEDWIDETYKFNF